MSYKPFVLPPVTTTKDVAVTQNSGVNDHPVTSVTTVTQKKYRYIYRDGVPIGNAENDISINSDDRALYMYLFRESGNSGNSGNTEPIYSRELGKNVLPPGGNSGNTDLTCYIGYVIDAAEWAWLKEECNRRHGSTWQFNAMPHEEGYKVTGLRVKP